MAIIFHVLDIKISSAAEVFKALTSSGGLASWWTTGAEVSAGQAIFPFTPEYHKTMRIVELLPEKRVLWECVEGDRQWLGTTVAFEIEQEKDGLSLKFYHAGWEEETDLFGHCNFQWAKYLNSLKQYLETGQGNPHKFYGQLAQA